MSHPSDPQPQPDSVPSVYSDTGKIQGYKSCCEIILGFIHDKAALALIKNDLTEHNNNAKARCEKRYKSEIVRKGWTENNIIDIAVGERDAIQDIIGRLLP